MGASLWGHPAPRQLRKSDHQVPVEPGRRPSSQRRPLPDRPHPDEQPSRDPDVCGTATRRRLEHRRNHALSQTLRRPSNLQRSTPRDLKPWVGSDPTNRLPSSIVTVTKHAHGFAPPNQKRSTLPTRADSSNDATGSDWAHQTATMNSPPSNSTSAASSHSAEHERESPSALSTGLRVATAS